MACFKVFKSVFLQFHFSIVKNNLVKNSEFVVVIGKQVKATHTCWQFPQVSDFGLVHHRAGHLCKSDNSPILGDNRCKQRAHYDIDKLEQNQLCGNKLDIQGGLWNVSFSIFPFSKIKYFFNDYLRSFWRGWRRKYTIEILCDDLPMTLICCLLCAAFVQPMRWESKA